jgi:hypothetical protein
VKFCILLDGVAHSPLASIHDHESYRERDDRSIVQSVVIKSSRLVVRIGE